MRVAYDDGWDVDIERGPDWLFIKVHSPETGFFGEDSLLADRVWELMRQNFVRRLVLELDEISALSSYLLGQLVQLHKRLYEDGGLLRLSGLAPECEAVLRRSRLHDRLQAFPTRAEAVVGARPTKPR